MNDGTTPAGTGWFAGGDPDDLAGASEAITEGGADEPADWPALAVEAGHVDSEEAYYEWLHEATLHATRREVRERERADDAQLVHAIRAMDDRTGFLL